MVKPIEPKVQPLAWDEAERRHGLVVWPEMRRLWRRARRRFWRPLLLTLLITGGVVGMRARKQRVYLSRIAFRITESDLDAETAPRTVGSLRDYVAQVCFSNQRLLSVIRAHDLYPSPMRRGDEAMAVEAMRDDVEVEVWRNFFALPRSPDDPGRSARMAISYQGRDRTVVYDVVRDLARLITEEEETSRIAQAEGALNDAEDRVRQARALAQEKHHDLVVKQVALTNARVAAERARLDIEQVSLSRQARSADDEVLAAEKMRQAVWLRLQLEKKRLGLQFELVDGGRVAPVGLSKKKLLLMVAIVVFVFTLPLAMLGVGALDDRVYEIEDVQRLGLTALGALPRFGGDNRGALVERLAREARQRRERGNG
jgi:hypothetical protein